MEGVVRRLGEDVNCPVMDILKQIRELEMFKNMKIGVRLGLGFGLVLLLLAIVTFIGVTRLSDHQRWDG